MKHRPNQNQMNFSNRMIKEARNLTADSRFEAKMKVEELLKKNWEEGYNLGFIWGKMVNNLTNEVNVN